MFKLETEAALRDAFRPKDRDVLELPPGVAFPLFVRDYLAWPHPAGGKVFLVFAVPSGTPTGISFETTGASGSGVSQMCDWCHNSGNASDVGLLTTRLNSNKRVGVYVCVDLSCRRKVEDEANRAGRSPLPVLKALLERIGTFASDGLKIDLFRS